ncbi:MAG: hypothetical protein JWL71_2424 [Acidobacteria bacterium]|nr:hypothetical protein [Acidobacteriota bacterium]
MLPAILFAVSLAFGPQVIDLSLQLDDSARQSLKSAPDGDVPGTMTFTDAGREQSFSVTVHVKGQRGSARPLDDKPAFKIKLASGQRWLGLEHLTLNNMVQDATMLHEALAYQVYADAGVAVPRTGYLRLKVDGQDLGLYLNVETIDHQFLDRVFHDRSGILYEGAYGVDLRDGDQTRFELHEGSDPNRARLASFIRAVHTAGDGVFYGAAAQVDTPSFLAMMAAAALLGDWDNYYASNNYRIYWNPSTRHWHFIPTGADQTFSPESMTIFGGTGVLFQKCLASDRCTSDYVKALRDVSLRFERLALPTKIDALLSVIDAPSRADVKRPYDEAAVRTARESMRAFVDTQPGQVRRALACIDEEGGSFEACAGEVIVSAAANDACLEQGSRSGGRHGAATANRCLGGAKQRWRLIPQGDAFAIRSVANGECLDVASTADEGEMRVHQSPCSEADSQRFELRPSAPKTHLAARQTAQCVTPAADDPKTPPVVVLQPCATATAQEWRVQRSIFK